MAAAAELVPAPLEQVPDLHRAFEARALTGRSLIRLGGEI